MNKQNNKLSILNSIILFAVIWFSKDTLLFGTNADTRYEMILFASMPVLMVWAFSIGCSRKSVITNNACIVAIAYCGLVVFTMLLTDHAGGNLKYIYECMMIFLAFFVCTIIPVNDFKCHFVNIMSFLAVFSLITFALRYFFPGINRFFPTVVNTAGYSYTNLWLAVIPHDIQYVTFRNYGIFREPGAYQGFLNLALLFYFCEPESHKNWQFIALVLALVFTFSTAGYLIFGVIILLQIFLQRTKINLKNLLVMCMIALIVALLFIIGIIEYDSSVFRKLLVSNSSINSRFGSILVDAFLGLQSPIWGNGFEYVEQNFGRTALEVFSLSNMSNTNTVLKLFAVHGFGIFIIVISGILNFCKRHIDSKTWIFHAFVIGLILSNEDMMFNTCVYIIMMYGFVNTQGGTENNETNADQRRPLRQYRADHVSTGRPGRV